MQPERRETCIIHSQEIKGIKEDTTETKGDVKIIMKILQGNGGLGLVAQVKILWGIGIYVAFKTGWIIFKIIEKNVAV